MGGCGQEGGVSNGSPTSVMYVCMIYVQGILLRVNMRRWLSSKRMKKRERERGGEREREREKCIGLKI